MKSYEEYKESRRRIMSDDYRTKKLIKVHDRGVTKATVCNLCGTTLAEYSPASGGIKIKRRYWHLNFKGFLYVNLCENPSMCYNSYKAMKGGED